MKISKVHSRATLVQKLIPIQSLSQLSSYLLATLIGVLLFIEITSALGLPAATPVILLGAFSGSSVILSMALPADLVLEFGSKEELSEMRGVVEKKIEKLGYAGAARGFYGSTYVSKLPAILSWKENRLELLLEGETLTILGPVFVIRMLRSSIARIGNV